MTALSLAEYRALPRAQRNLPNWRRMSEADHGAYMEVGGADAPANNPAVVAEAETVIDPAITATVARMRELRSGERRSPATARRGRRLARIRRDYEAASGVKSSAAEHTDG